MIPSLALAITVTAIVLGPCSIVAALLGRSRPISHRTATRVLEIALVAQLVGSVVGIARGQHPAELSTFLAYALTSVVVLPILVTGLAGDGSTWDGPLWPALLAGIGFIAVAVVVLRMGQTWRVSGG